MAGSELTPERRSALARKGELLYARQCAKPGGSTCAEEFVVHELRLGHDEVARDFLEFLRGQLRAADQLGDQELQAKTAALISCIEMRLVDRS